jgi:Sugar (and other) transporter
MATVANPAGSAGGGGVSKEETRVIFASSLGTVFEWYDFYLYAVLAPFFAVLFFPSGNATAALLSAFAAYAAGFLVRPFGALVFGRIGDLVGRKYTFLVTIIVMGFSTFAVGLLPTYASVGWLAPILMVSLRLLQGLALGGEYGGAATYVAEHAAPGRRGYDTAWIQTTATLGLFLALLVIGLCRFTGWLTPAQFSEWGWRLPFLVSLLLLVFSIYIRLKLNESPVFQRMKAEGKGSKAPLTDSFLRYPNNKYVLLALLGATAGQGVVWYTGQFYALFFLTITLKVDGMTAYTLIAISLLLGTPFFIVFGWLSDKIGRLKIILFGCLIAALTFFPLFGALTHYVNPALEAFQKANPITVSAKECNFHIFVGPWSKFTDCDKAKDFLTKSGLSFTSVNLPADSADAVTVKIGDTELKGFDAPKWTEALKAKGYVAGAAKDQINWGMTLLILFIMVLYVTMVYGPIAAFLVEMFPTKIRYTSMSLPYHIGNGWFGGMLPLLATAMVAASGDIYFGLWYPICVALMTFVIGLIFLKDRMGTAIDADESAYQ